MSKSFRSTFIPSRRRRWRRRRPAVTAAVTSRGRRKGKEKLGPGHRIGVCGLASLLTRAEDRRTRRWQAAAS
jgi:hypothetical protein